MPTLQAEPRIVRQDLEAMVRYYRESGPDYAAWSPAFNMHFGYWQSGINPLNREAMLECMNQRVTRSLEGCGSVLDMGCGVGATARSLSRRSPETQIDGITVVPWQVERARQMTTANPRIHFHEDDYTQCHFPDQTFDGVYAIESFCHGPGRDKAACLQEARRVLRHGGTLTIADGFLRTAEPLHGLLACCHQRICECWSMDSLPVLPEVLACLADTGFRVVAVEDVAWRVGFSVAHVPFVTARFLLRELFEKHSQLSRERWNNLFAPLLTGVVGLARQHFGYYILHAEAR